MKFDRNPQILFLQFRLMDQIKMSFLQVPPICHTVVVCFIGHSHLLPGNGKLSNVRNPMSSVVDLNLLGCKGHQISNQNIKAHQLEMKVIHYEECHT